MIIYQDPSLSLDATQASRQTLLQSWKIEYTDPALTSGKKFANQKAACSNSCIDDCLPSIACRV